jgi:hypothetical protein
MGGLAHEDGLDSNVPAAGGDDCRVEDLFQEKGTEMRRRAAHGGTP